MAKRIGIVVFAAFLLIGPVSASAASSWSSAATYSEKVTGKLKYGLTNALLGWTSLFRTPMKANKGVENVLVGIGKGIYNAIGQTVLGAVDVVTFPIPQIDVPLPEGGTDVLG